MKYLVCVITALCIVSTIQLEEETTENSIAIKGTTDMGINNFGLNLLKTMMKQNENHNVVISPTGIAGLLAMTLLGSTGETYNEIAQLIGFSEDILKNRMYHEDFGTRLQSLNSKETMTLYANGLFVNRNTTLRQVYQTYLERVYKGEAFVTDFGDTDEAKTVINEWVKNHTQNRIENFLQQPLPISTKAVLLSALYYSGQWSHPFIPEYTKQLPFQTPTKEVLVDLMANFGQFNYVFSIENGLHMIQLPYNDSVTSMYVIKPRFPKTTTITELLNRLDFEKIDNLINQMSRKKCVIRFPKMELESKLDLKEALKALGAQSMFTPGVANFAVMLESDEAAKDTEDNLITRISAGDGESRTLKQMVDRLMNPGVHVDSVMHEVKMSVDEFGTEAVAATSALMARSAETFYADSPFYMFIRNENTKLVTFSAVVYDPTE
ncbi:unnamed protein product [Diatraea saccharalis]|uniref:Serpin domain-containing protein n=1 Tax=Diatraea saccharalis TaxID=40085 RepID=A0A9N9QXW8_9NEOP|nr:unnamed protein product [Diatraea saccharalis]